MKRADSPPLPDNLSEPVSEDRLSPLVSREYFARLQFLIVLQGTTYCAVSKLDKSFWLQFRYSTMNQRRDCV